MDHTEQLIWRYALDNKTLDAVQIGQALNVTVQTVQNYLNKIGTPAIVLEEAGYTVGTLDMQVGGSHYKDMVIQPFEALAAWLTPEEHRGYHKGVAISYLAREQAKGGSDDIRKAIHHLQRLLEVEADTSK